MPSMVGESRYFRFRRPASLACRLRYPSHLARYLLTANCYLWISASLAICLVFRHFQPKASGRKMQVAENKALPEKLTPKGATRKR